MTTIRFDLDETSNPISLQIYDITGRIMETLIYEKLKSGYHELQWDASASASGVYFVELVSDKNRSVQKLILLK
jgi:flagellar hook assembly protein FlgD